MVPSICFLHHVYLTIFNSDHLVCKLLVCILVTNDDTNVYLNEIRKLCNSFSNKFKQNCDTIVHIRLATNRKSLFCRELIRLFVFCMFVVYKILIYAIERYQHVCKPSCTFFICTSCRMSYTYTKKVGLYFLGLFHINDV